ncbi:MAG: serine--tRNA ligase, partial [Myxococcales bacterium]|nr:serine--tRNA ligase [Myxococcales bacterium]
MLDARDLEERREDILESCRRRGVTVDLDAAIAAHGRVQAAQTAVNDANRLRNEHQKSGQRKMDDAEREAHTAEGRRLKEAVGRHEEELASARGELERHLDPLPNFIHPDVPVGGEEDFRELRRVGEPTPFDFDPLDHLGVAARLDAIDFENAAKVAGQKFYYLKNDAVLLELALQRFALDVLIAEGFTPYVTPDLARPEIVAGLGYN